MRAVIQGGVASETAMRGDGSGQGVARRGDMLVWVLLAISVGFFVLTCLHPRSDFPNGSPWSDWSKMTDEGWYGGAAVHHFVQGGWYLADSFNPAVAMPVWPAMLAGWFGLTGVSMLGARLLTLLLYGISLVLLYRVVWRARPGRSAAVAVLLVVVNPFCYAFDRLAVLEPVTVFCMMVALWLAQGSRGRAWWRLVLLGVVVFLLVLTKVTGVALVPAVLYLLWAEWGWAKDLRAWMGAGVVVGTAVVLWAGYQMVVVRPRYLEDYKYLFSINAYRVHLSIVPKMAWVTMRDGMWMGAALWVLAVAVGVASVVWLRELWRLPLFGAAAVAVAGHLAYVGYHTNFQPRYYLVITMPVVMVLVLGLAAVWDRRVPWARPGMAVGMAAVMVAMAAQTWLYAMRPQYSFLEAAEGIAAIVRSDGGPKPMLLSDSGDDITLLTGIPAVTAGYAVHGQDAMLERYKPGWYAAWPGWEDPEIRQVAQRYKLDQVAEYRVFDDPKRQVLVLYKLTPR